MQKLIGMLKQQWASHRVASYAVGATLGSRASMLQTATWASQAAAHSWGVVATGRTSIGHKGMMYAAKVMAIAAAELALSPALLERARQEFEAALAQTPYVCPIPPEVGPPQHEHPLRQV